MSLLKLRLSMYGTLAAIIAISTLFFAAVLSALGAFNIFFLAGLVFIFNLLQWLYAPKMIEAIYKVREIKPSEAPRLHEIFDRLVRRIGLREKPKLMLAEIPIPNAFAYGSPLTGSRVAVTRELLRTLEAEEVEAVLGHELGHLKHRDVQIMMFVSMLPAIFYFLGYSLLLSGYFGYGYRRDEGALLPIAIGGVSLAIYWILSLFVLGLSRCREYYADRASVAIVDDGARKLSEALAKIVYYSGRARQRFRQESGFMNSFRTLFIADPGSTERDLDALRASGWKLSDQALVREILSRRVTLADRIAELFSTHPNIVKRIRTLQQLSQEAS
ncbi:MAG: zinc metalloprotease HtpX [Candidatus Hecatellaceae archaeon]